MTKLLQNISWPLIYILGHLFFRVEIHCEEDISKLKGPLIIASNHIAPYDSFFLRLVFGRHTQLLPVRFMASSYFNNPVISFFWKIGVIKLIYIIFGVFTIPYIEGTENKLKPAARILEKGGVVYFFPEGTMSRSGIKPFKKGAATLALMTNTTILPLSYRIIVTPTIRRTFRVNVGKVIKIAQETEPIKATFILQEIIEKLYGNH